MNKEYGIAAKSQNIIVMGMYAWNRKELEKMLQEGMGRRKDRRDMREMY